MLRCRSRFAVFSLIYIFYSHIALSAQEKNAIASDLSSDADVLKAVEKLDEKGYAGQGMFINTVKNAGSKSIPILRQNLRHRNSEVRKASLIALKTIKAPCEDVANDVEPLLSDSDKRVRYNAIFYLAVQSCFEKKNALLNRINSESDTDVRRNIVDGLGRLGNQSDIQTLISIQNSSNEPIKIRLSAARSLLMLNQACDISLVRSSLASQDQNILLSALDVCEYSPSQTLIPTIKLLLSHTEPITSRATKVIDSIVINQYSLPERIEKLFAIIEKEQSKQVWAAGQLIYKYPQKSVISKLRSIAFDEKNPAAFAILGELDLAGYISREEMKEQMEKIYAQSDIHK